MPPSLEKIELEYDKLLLKSGAYGEPTVYKDNNSICHLYLALYPVDTISFTEENQRTICVIPEGFRPRIPVVLSGGFWGSLKDPSTLEITREPMFVRIDENGNIIIFYAPQSYKSIGQIWVDGTWVAE